MLASILVLLAATGNALAGPIPAPPTGDGALTPVKNDGTQPDMQGPLKAKFALCTKEEDPKNILCVGDDGSGSVTLQHLYDGYESTDKPKYSKLLVWHEIPVSSAPYDFKEFMPNMTAPDGNGKPVTIMKSETPKIPEIPDIPAKLFSTWHTDNGHVKLNGTKMCLDVTEGQFKAGTRLQVWQCAEGNTHQIWGGKIFNETYVN